MASMINRPTTEVRVMGSKRLESVAAAAGYAMVNPDDFAGEAAPALEPRHNEHVSATPGQQPIAIKKSAPKTWLTWDYFRLSGFKAPA